MVSLLQGTHYKVVFVAGRPVELDQHSFAKGRRALAIVGIDRKNGSLDQAGESIKLLRSLMPDGKVIILVAEGNGEFDVSNILTIAPDGYILNLGSSDVLLKALELLFMDQKIFVIGFPTATPPNKP